MPSLVPEYEYDVFISYRQNDNRSGWVTQFVEHLREELAATIKEPVNIYFDANPHDGLQDTHHVDKSLEGKLKCLVFIPVLSRTYCDVKSFAWNSEFLAFRDLCGKDGLGLHVALNNRNVSSRIIPVQIHELDKKDQEAFVRESGSALRSVDFTFRSAGVNRPLLPEDERSVNVSKTVYRDQINKLANAIAGVVSSMAEGSGDEGVAEVVPHPPAPSVQASGFMAELIRRNVFRAAFTYLVVALLFVQLLLLLTSTLKIEDRIVNMVIWIILGGFPLAIILAWFYELSPQGFIRTNSQQSLSNPYPPYRKKPLTSVTITSILFLTLLIQTVILSSRSPAIKPAADAEGNKLVSIAVLPFENRTGDKSDKYIADGITDDIINRLTNIGNVRVTNRASTKQYQGELMPYNEIVQDLDVMALLVGSVQREGSQLVVRVQLIDGNSLDFIWGNTYYRTPSNLHRIEAEITHVVVSRLHVDLTELELERLTIVHTSNEGAYEYYVKGRDLYYKYTKSANDSAIALFKEAVLLDPKYAIAWAGLGDSYGQIYGRFAGELSWCDSAIKIGLKALSLDSNLAEGYKTVALGYNYKRDYTTAFPLLLKAATLSPSNVQVMGNLGTAYFFRGELVEALRAQKRSAELNPKNWIPYQNIGWYYYYLGDMAKAEESLRKSLELRKNGQTYELLGYVLVSQGRNDEALKLIPKTLELGQDDFKVLEKAGLIAHFAGDAIQAKEYYRRSIENDKSYRTKPNPVCPIGLGQILLQEGKRVEADVYLSHAMQFDLGEIARGSQDDEPPIRIAGIHAIRGEKAEMLTVSCRTSMINVPCSHQQAWIAPYSFGR